MKALGLQSPKGAEGLGEPLGKGSAFPWPGLSVLAPRGAAACVDRRCDAGIGANLPAAELAVTQVSVADIATRGFFSFPGVQTGSQHTCFGTEAVACPACNAQQCQAARQPITRAAGNLNIARKPVLSADGTANSPRCSHLRCPTSQMTSCKVRERPAVVCLARSPN